MTLGGDVFFVEAFIGATLLDVLPIFCKGNDPKMIDHVHMTRAYEGSPCICEAGTEIPGIFQFLSNFLAFCGFQKKVEKASS